jgi:hypothetical protein
MNSTLLNYYYYYLQMHKWLTKVTTKVVKKRYQGKSSNESCPLSHCTRGDQGTSHIEMGLVTLLWSTSNLYIIENGLEGEYIPDKQEWGSQLFSANVHGPSIIDAQSEAHALS